MRHVSGKSVIFGIIIASLFWGGLAFLMEYDYEIPKPSEWPVEIKMKENPVTQNRRVIDSDAKATIFWSSGNPIVIPIEVKKIGPNRWSVIFEKPQ